MSTDEVLQTKLNQLLEMRTRTLGEYRDLFVLIGGERCRPVQYLDDKIAKQGRDEPVIADEAQMLVVLASMLEDEKDPLQ